MKRIKCLAPAIEETLKGPQESEWIRVRGSLDISTFESRWKRRAILPSTQDKHGFNSDGRVSGMPIDISASFRRSPMFKCPSLECQRDSSFEAVSETVDNACAAA
jgi:hypothetical protein